MKSLKRFPHCKQIDSSDCGPGEYEIEDLAMIASSVKEENILQDNSGKHEPLAAN